MTDLVLTGDQAVLRPLASHSRASTFLTRLSAKSDKTEPIQEPVKTNYSVSKCLRGFKCRIFTWFNDMRYIRQLFRLTEIK